MKLRTIAEASLAMLVVAALALACAGSADAGRRNEELMRSLPVLEQATLVRTYASDPPDGPYLWYEFATPTAPSAVAVFYRDMLPRDGWQLLQEGQRQGLTFQKDGAELTVYFWGHEPPAFQTEFSQVASPPLGTPHFFMVRMGASGK